MANSHNCPSNTFKSSWVSISTQDPFKVDNRIIVKAFKRVSDAQRTVNSVGFRSEFDLRVREYLLQDNEVVKI